MPRRFGLVKPIAKESPSTNPPTKHAALGPFYDIREMGLAALLAGLAGAIGAAAWLYTSGWYVTFMTGNSERLVLGHFTGEGAAAGTAAVTVIVFVLGAMTASLARIFLWRKARYGATVVTMAATVAAMLIDLTFVSNSATHVFGVVPVLCLAFGLGALNTSISRRGEVVMPLSYVTGTLVKIGQGAALHLAGIRRWSWVPQTTTYAGFLLGAAVGGFVFSSIGTNNSLIALAALTTVVAAGSWRLDHPRFIAQDGH